MNLLSFVCIFKTYFLELISGLFEGLSIQLTLQPLDLMGKKRQDGLRCGQIKKPTTFDDFGPLLLVLQYK